MRRVFRWFLLRDGENRHAGRMTRGASLRESIGLRYGKCRFALGIADGTDGTICLCGHCVTSSANASSSRITVTAAAYEARNEASSAACRLAKREKQPEANSQDHWESPDYFLVDPQPCDDKSVIARENRHAGRVK